MEQIVYVILVYLRINNFALKMYSKGKKKPRKSAVYADFGDFFVYSHSIVAGGLEVMS